MHLQTTAGMPFMADRVPIYPRPTSPVHAEPITFTKSDISYQSSSNDDELGGEETAAKRRRIELCAARYLRGEPLFILSASLKGPLDGGKWINPWRKKTGAHGEKFSSKGSRINTVRSRHHVEIPETIHRSHDQAHSVGANSSAAVPNHRSDTWLKSNDGYIQKQVETRLPSPTPLRSKRKSTSAHEKISPQAERAEHAMLRQRRQDRPPTDVARKVHQAVDERLDVLNQKEVSGKVDPPISTATKVAENRNLPPQTAESRHDAAEESLNIASLLNKTVKHEASHPSTAPSAQPVEPPLQHPIADLLPRSEINTGVEWQLAEPDSLPDHTALHDEKGKTKDPAQTTTEPDKRDLQHERRHDASILDDFKEDEILASSSPPIYLASIKRAIMGRNYVDTSLINDHIGQKVTEKPKSRHKVKKPKHSAKEPGIAPRNSMKSALKVAKASDNVDAGVGKVAKDAPEHFESAAPVLTAPAAASIPTTDLNATIPATTTPRPNPIRRQSSRVSFAAPDPPPQPTNSTAASTATSNSLPLQPSHQIDPNSPSRLAEHPPPFNPSSELHQIQIPNPSTQHRQSDHFTEDLTFQKPWGKMSPKRRADVEEGGGRDEEAEEGGDSFDLKSAIDDLGSFLNTWDVEKDVSAISAGSY